MLNYIKALSINYDSCMDGQTLSMFKNAGFDGIDFGFGKDYFLDKKWEERTYKLKELLDKEKIVCTQVHLPFYGIFESSEITREDKDYEIMSAFKCLSILGAKWGAARHTETDRNTVY